MKKSQQTADTDISEQRYHGPSPLVAGAGEGFLRGKFLLAAGIVGGAIAGAIFPTALGKFVNKCRGRIGLWQTSENLAIQGFGDISQWLLKSGEGFVNFGRKALGENFAKHENSERWGTRIATAIDSSILISAALWVAGIFTGMFTGARSSHRGKRQFEAAKSEILTLRAENERLRTKLVDTQMELEDSHTADSARKGTLKVAQDETPRLTPNASVNGMENMGLLDAAARNATAENALG